MTIPIRQLIDLARQEGLEVTRTEKSRHLKLWVRVPGTEQERLFVASGTPSDRRTENHNRAILRRIKRG